MVLMNVIILTNEDYCQLLIGVSKTLQWRHNGCDGVSNHQPHDCLLKRLIRRRSKKTSKLRVTGLCAGIHRWPVNSRHKGPVKRKMFPFDDVIMKSEEIHHDIEITHYICKWFVMLICTHISWQWTCLNLINPICANWSTCSAWKFRVTGKGAVTKGNNHGQ